jgi:hypothetical protein
MTFGSLPSITATTELVVPKSIPMIFPMGANPFKVCDIIVKSYFLSSYRFLELFDVP